MLRRALATDRNVDGGGARSRRPRSRCGRRYSGSAVRRLQSAEPTRAASFRLEAAAQTPRWEKTPGRGDGRGRGGDGARAVGARRDRRRRYAAAGSSSSDSASDDEDEWGRAARRRAGAAASIPRHPMTTPHSPPSFRLRDERARAMVTMPSPTRPPRPDIAHPPPSRGSWTRRVETPRRRGVLPGRTPTTGRRGEDDEAWRQSRRRRRLKSVRRSERSAARRRRRSFGESTARARSSTARSSLRRPRPRPGTRRRPRGDARRHLGQHGAHRPEHASLGGPPPRAATLAFGEPLVPRAMARTFARFGRQNRWPASAEDDGTFSSSGDRGSGTPRGWPDARPPVGVTFLSAGATAGVRAAPRERWRRRAEDETPAARGDVRGRARQARAVAGGTRRPRDEARRGGGGWPPRERRHVGADARVVEARDYVSFDAPRRPAGPSGGPERPSTHRRRSRRAAFAADGAAVDAFLAHASSSGSPRAVPVGFRAARGSRGGDAAGGAAAIRACAARLRSFRSALASAGSPAAGLLARRDDARRR